MPDKTNNEFKSLGLDRDKMAYIKAILAGPEPYIDTNFIRLAAVEISHYYNVLSVEDVRKIRPMILTRTWSAIRAQNTRSINPARQIQSREAVKLNKSEMPYSSFFAVQDTSLQHQRFDGTVSEEMPRAAFLMADAVTVLPYDPVRDRVLLIEQFRFGPYARGDLHPWMYEAIAGRIDAGETAKRTAEREAQEEAGITLSSLHFVADYYPSPGGVTEFITSYIGVADLPDGTQGIGGLDCEHEDIASSLHDFNDLMVMCDAGQLDTGPLYISALWLARHRDRLRLDRG